MAVTADQLPGRRARYFMEQQIGLHGTIVSIALYALGLPVLRRASPRSSMGSRTTRVK